MTMGDKLQADSAGRQGGGTQPFAQVDAFTDRPFAGNPAAVCLLPAARDSAWMQLVAREMNLAETAFLVRRKAILFALKSSPKSRPRAPTH